MLDRFAVFVFQEGIHQGHQYALAEEDVSDNHMMIYTTKQLEELQSELKKNINISKNLQKGRH